MALTKIHLDQISSDKQRHHTHLQCFHHLFLLAEIGTLGLANSGSKGIKRANRLAQMWQSG